jgi:hypothetical protein
MEDHPGENRSVEQTASQGAGMEPQSLDRIRFVTRHFNELQGLREGVPHGLRLLGLGALMFFPNLWTALLCTAVLLASSFLRRGSAAYYRRLFGEVESAPLAGGRPVPLSLFSSAGPVPQPLSNPPQRRFSGQQWSVLTGAVLLYLAVRAVSPAAAVLTDDSAQDPWLQLNAPVVETFVNGGPVSQTAAPGSLLLQAVYVLFGAFLLGVWLRREHRLSQSHYLVLGALLLALALFGASLGFVTPALWKLGIARIEAFVLPPVAHLWMALILCGAALILAGLLDHWQLARVLGRPAEEPS